MDVKSRYESLAAEYFGFYYRSFPTTATWVGIHDHDGMLGDYDGDALDDVAAKLRRYAAKLSALDPRRLNPDDAADLKMLAARARQEVRETDDMKVWKNNPANYAEVAANGVHDLLVREFASLDARLESVLGRLRDVPAVLAAARENVADPPRVFVETAREMVAGLGALIRSVPPRASDDALRRDLERAAARANAATAEYAAHLKVMLPGATGEFAAGRETFDAMLRDYHMLPYDADSLIAEGKRLYRQTEEELAKAASEIEPGASVFEVDRRLKESHPTADELLEAYRREVIRARMFVEERGIFRLPEGEELRVELTPPAFAPLIPGAMYMNPAPLDEQKTGIFFVTAPGPEAPPDEWESRLRNHPYHKLPITALHEGYPGHHLQLSRANAHPSRIRRQLESDLFVEGWAFYCEELMERLGYSDAPEVRFARLKQQLWRAARIIIDGSLHTGKMGFEEAAELLVGVGFERGSAVSEVRRYCQTPTQPMSYLIGKLRILKIHERYRDRKGKEFDLADFHERLLSLGSITPALAEELLLG